MVICFFVFLFFWVLGFGFWVLGFGFFWGKKMSCLTSIASLFFLAGPRHKLRQNVIRQAYAVMLMALGLHLMVSPTAGADWQKLVREKGCTVDFDQSAVDSSELIKCTEQIIQQPWTPQEVALLEQRVESSAEGQIALFLKGMAGEIQTVIDSGGPHVATRLNRLFETFRDGDGSRSAVSIQTLLPSLAANSSRAKLTAAIVLLLKSGQIKQSLKAKSALKRTMDVSKNDVEVVLAGRIVELLETEMCLRGYDLQTKWWQTSTACKQNRRHYVPWSQLTPGRLVTNRFRAIFNDPQAWTRNHLFLLKNGPVLDHASEHSLFDSRMALLEGDYRRMEKTLWQQMQNAGITASDLARRTRDPYDVLFMWGFYDDPIGFEYARYFVSPERRWVKHLGMIDKALVTRDAHRQTYAILSNGGFLLGADAPRTLFGAGMHRKALAVDGKFAILGGRNFGYLYSKYWRDTDILMAGPAAAEISKIFAQADRQLKQVQSQEQNAFLGAQEGGSVRERSEIEFWQRADSSPEVLAIHEKIKKTGEEVLVLDTSPRARTPDHILAAHLHLLDIAAKGTTVHIENAYVVMTPPLRQALRAALKRGVKIEVHTNSAITSDEPVVTMPIMLSVKEMLEMPSLVGAAPGSMKVYLRQGRYTEMPNTLSHNLMRNEIEAMRPRFTMTLESSQPSTLHSKYMMAVDASGTAYSIITSYNLHPRSHRLEDELAVVVKSPKPQDPRSTYAQLKTWFYEKDPLIDSLDPRLNAIFGTLAHTDSAHIPIFAPQSWSDLQSLPAAPPPQHGRWVFVNSLVALTMTLGFENL